MRINKKLNRRNKPKKGSKKQTSLNGIYKKYTDLESKGSIQNTLIKGVTEIAAGAGLGSLTAAATGKSSPIIGAVLVLIGNYVGDKSGLIKSVGIGTIAYGVAKANDSGNMDSKQRLTDLKSNWLAALHINQKKEAEKIKAKKQKVPSSPITKEQSKSPQPNSEDAASVQGTDSLDESFGFAIYSEPTELETKESATEKTHKSESQTNFNDEDELQSWM